MSSADPPARPLPPNAALAPSARPVAASALLVGGMLAFAASFLPLGQSFYPGGFGEPASTQVTVPAQFVATSFAVALRHHVFSLSETLLWPLALWGAPLVLAALGIGVLLAPIRRLRARTRILGLLLVVLGAAFVILMCLAHQSPFFGSQGAILTLTYGPVVGLLGYLGALVGIIRLPARSGSAATQG